MQALLSGWGCRVLLAESSARAVAAVSVPGVEAPHVILADYHLDEGTGVMAVAAVRQATGLDIPAVIISADHSADVQREVRRLGYPQLRKPLKAAALRSILTQCVLRRSAAE
jgi:CheY-like chemotaxis protein